MKTKELRAIISKILVSKKTDALETPWEEDLLLATISTIIYPFIRDITINEDEDQHSFTDFYNNLQDFLKKVSGTRKNGRYAKYSEEALIEAFKKEWVPTLTKEEKEKYATALPMVEAINDSRHVIFKEKFFGSYTRGGIDIPNREYGDCQYEVTSPVPPNTHSANNTNCAKEEKEYEKKNKFDDFWESNNLPTKLKDGEFFWQLNIDGSLYKEIERHLKDLHFETNSRLLRQYSFHIALYIAEWFKREYDGNNGNSPLKNIGLDTSNSAAIWNHIRNKNQIPENYLINNGQDQRMYSMYVLGGFPIKYVCNGTRFNSLFEKIWLLSNDEDNSNDFDFNEIEDFTESFDGNNSIYCRSLQAGGSLYHYIQEVFKGEEFYPIAREDARQDPFSSFIRFLNDGKQLRYENFFKERWVFYTDLSINGLECQFRVYIGNKSDASYIPKACLMQLGKMDDIDDLKAFYLGLKYNKAERPSQIVRFSKVGNRYLSWGTKNFLSMPLDWSQIDTEKKIELVLYKLADQNFSEGITLKEFKLRNHFQLYKTTTPYQWSTRSKREVRTALLFNQNKYYLDSEDGANATVVQDLTDTCDEWIWVPIFNKIVLHQLADQAELTFSAERGNLGVEFRRIQGVQYLSNNEVEIEICKDESSHIETMPLMCGTEGIKKVCLYPFERELKAQELDSNAFTIEFKQDDAPNHQEYINIKDQSPSTGIIKIRIKDINETHSKIIRCFYLPQGFDVRRNLQEKWIEFFPQGTAVYYPENDKYERLTGDKFRFNDDFAENENLYNRNEDCIPFKIGANDSNKERLLLRVYRANPCEEFYLNDELIGEHRISNENINIPLILRHLFKSRVINENGVLWKELDSNVWLNYKFTKTENGFIRSDSTKEDNITYYLYENKDCNGKPYNYIHLGNEDKDQYKFFYWSFKANEGPKEVKTDYNSETKELEISLGSFNNGESNGIIFQSLKGVCPRHYVKPLYPLNTPKMENLANPYFSPEIQRKCFEIACEHQIYFGQFYPLWKLFNGDDTYSDVIKFFFNVAEYSSMDKERLFKEMHRFAEEFMFNWMMLPQSKWKKESNTNGRKKLVSKLFIEVSNLASQTERFYLHRFADRYFNLSIPKDFRRQAEYTPNIILQSMRNIKGDFHFFKRRRNRGNGWEEFDKETIITVLNDIKSCSNIYHNLYALALDKNLIQ